MAGELEKQARYVGPAALTGRLFRIDWYPALITDSAPEKNYPVRGDVYQLPEDPQELLRTFDAYESYDPANPERSEYLRLARPVKLSPNGKTVEAWVYLYRPKIATETEVPDGDWLAELRRQGTNIQTKNRGW